MANPSRDGRMPQAGGSNVPTAPAEDAAAGLGQEDAAIAALPENATEPEAPANATQDTDGSGKSSDRLSPAGSHARPELTNHDATPGTGVLPAAGGRDEVDAASS